jgi:hypothetical protein
MTFPPTRLTDAERIHLDHYHWEEFPGQAPGPAHAWNAENGIMPHELLPLDLVRAAEWGRRQPYPQEPEEPWAPPAENADAFRARVKEITEAQNG